MIDLIHQETLKQFREELYAEGILHDGDTIGTNDETLLCVNNKPSISFNPTIWKLGILFIRRFLRARRFDLVQSKKMFKDCQQWRKTVEGVGIDELYRRIDPFDVSHLINYRWTFDMNKVLKFPEREVIFNCWPTWYHKVRNLRYLYLNMYYVNIRLLDGQGWIFY